MRKMKKMGKGIKPFRYWRASEHGDSKPFAEICSRSKRNRRREVLGLAAGALVLAFSAGAYADSTAAYTYDALGRLIKVVYSDGTRTATITYSYDAAGNRTRVVTSGNS
jgi:hypothetical protein